MRVKRVVEEFACSASLSADTPMTSNVIGTIDHLRILEWPHAEQALILEGEDTAASYKFDRPVPGVYPLVKGTYRLATKADVSILASWRVAIEGWLTGLQRPPEVPGPFVQWHPGERALVIGAAATSVIGRFYPNYAGSLLVRRSASVASADDLTLFTECGATDYRICAATFSNLQTDEIYLASDVLANDQDYAPLVYPGVEMVATLRNNSGGNITYSFDFGVCPYGFLPR